VSLEKSKPTFGDVGPVEARRKLRRLLLRRCAQRLRVAALPRLVLVGVLELAARRRVRCLLRFLLPLLVLTCGRALLLQCGSFGALALAAGCLGRVSRACGACGIAGMTGSR